MLETFTRNAAESSMTRNELVRMEGRDAAKRNALAHDNPYRSGSADGIAWRVGFDSVAAD